MNGVCDPFNTNDVRGDDEIIIAFSGQPTPGTLWPRILNLVGYTPRDAVTRMLRQLDDDPAHLRAIARPLGRAEIIAGTPFGPTRVVASIGGLRADDINFVLDMIARELRTVGPA